MDIYALSGVDMINDDKQLTEGMAADIREETGLDWTVAPLHYPADGDGTPARDEYMLVLTERKLTARRFLDSVSIAEEGQWAVDGVWYPTTKAATDAVKASV